MGAATQHEAQIMGGYNLEMGVAVNAPLPAVVPAALPAASAPP